ncbi:MAG: hypothetical protein H6Q70_4622 [Firmicutes bacterium]|nr:hypothetical protein [Bacillota bacterium]
MYELDKYTVSLLHFDDEIKDETGKVWTAKNSAAVSTAESKFGKSSLYLNSTQYLSSPNNGDFSFNSGDFTVECWVKRNDYSNINQALFEVVSDNGNAGNPVGYGAYLTLGASLNGVFGFYNNNSTSGAAVVGTTVIPVGEWTHIAGVRHNNTLYLFKNGVLENTADCTGCSVNPNSATLANIGSYANNAWGNAYSGYIDEFRISNIARWTENFDPNDPSSPQTDDGKYLLTITLAEEVEREYPVTKDELEAFIKWYDSSANGTGSAYYTFDKFLNRKDYIVFDKILTFEVTDFSK